MTKKEAADLLYVLKAQVEWGMPLDYQIALDMAIEALETSERLDMTIDTLKKELGHGNINSK